MIVTQNNRAKLALLLTHGSRKLGVVNFSKNLEILFSKSLSLTSRRLIPIPPAPFLIYLMPFNGCPSIISLIVEMVSLSRIHCLSDSFGLSYFHRTAHLYKYLKTTNARYTQQYC